MKYCCNMDGPIDYHTKWSKSDKDKYPIISLMWNLKNNTNESNLYTKWKQTHRHRKQTYGH